MFVFVLVLGASSRDNVKLLVYNELNRRVLDSLVSLHSLHPYPASSIGNTFKRIKLIHKPLDYFESNYSRIVQRYKLLLVKTKYIQVNTEVIKNCILLLLKRHI